MPTMAIAAIKYDGQGNPIHAKYRIVALGNLDQNIWSKSECFAPVLSQFELCFLTAQMHPEDWGRQPGLLTEFPTS